MVDVSMVQRGRGRFYRVDGDPRVDDLLPSVTSILNIISKPALVPWAKKITAEKFRSTLYAWQGDGQTFDLTDEAIESLYTEAKGMPDVLRDEAGDYGTRLHEALATQEPDAEERYPGIKAYYAWLEEQGLEVVHREVPVYHHVEGYGGTLDAIAYREGVPDPVILDYKTSSAIYWEVSLQIAAYAYAWNAMIQDDPVASVGLEGWALRFPKLKPTGKQATFEAKKISDMGESFNGFLSAKGLWAASKQKPWAVLG